MRPGGVFALLPGGVFENQRASFFLYKAYLITLPERNYTHFTEKNGALLQARGGFFFKNFPKFQKEQYGAPKFRDYHSRRWLVITVTPECLSDARIGASYNQLTPGYIVGKLGSLRCAYSTTGILLYRGSMPLLF